MWLGNNYCVHLQVSPFKFESSLGKIEEIVKYKITLNFDSKRLLKSKELYSNKINSLILNKDIAGKIQAEQNIQLENTDSWIDYTKNYLKLGVADDGIYRLNKNVLTGNGLNVESINPKTFKIFMKGKKFQFMLREKMI
ncbi:MAG: hypothetical protein H6613_01980 [Ignavibacteriales bacterium]|nr:hypothetical protein [Ignavibacteriales bacterium]